MRLLSRVRREASSADTSLAKGRRHERRSLEFCYWLIWVCWWDWVMVVVVSNCFMGMFWGRYFILLAITTLRTRKLGTNFVPQNSRWGIRHNITQYSCARILVTINKFKSWCLALVSFAAGFRVVMQSERCVVTLKTAVKETSLALEYFCLQPFAHIISVSRNLEAKWSHIQNSLCFFCAWISSLFKWSNRISGLLNKYKSWTTLHEGDFSTSEGIHVKIALPTTNNVIVVYRLVLCCHGEQPSDVACKYLSLVTLCSDTFQKKPTVYLVFSLLMPLRWQETWTARRSRIWKIWSPDWKMTTGILDFIN